jgi:vacuolar-type H+-ATPase subunit I/STV1
MNKTDIKQIILEEIEATLEEMRMSPEMMAAQSFMDDEENDDRIAQAMEMGDEDELEDLAAGELDRAGLEEMARTSNVFKLSQNADLKQVLQFMQRVNNVLKTYKSPGQKRPKKRFTPEEIKTLATAMLKPEGFTSKDVITATSYSSPAQANKFLKALEMKGLITLTSQLKKAMEPTRDSNAPETRGRKRRDAEFDMSDDPMADLDALGLGGSIDLSDPLAENKTTMSELEKYIKQVIKEAKNPLAKKMKEIETQGRRAALETKLAAIDEMIEETNGRLTRIDEDNEFRDMMDKNAVKEVRKQLKELERAKAKLQKEYGKMGNKLPKNYDEDGGKKVMDEDLPVEEDAVENAVDEVELEEDNFELNESVKRMQKLANLKG